jgi:DNA-binding transcriptional LysR family regulator
VSLADLQPYYWIVYPSRMPLRALLEREMSDAGIAMPTNVIETASTSATVALLQRSTDLVALLPQAVCEFFSAHRPENQPDLQNASRSSLISSFFVVHMPCGAPG